MDAEAARQLLARALAYGASAKLLGPNSQETLCGESVLRLQQSLEQLGLEDGQRHLQAFREDAEKDPEGYRAEYFRLFERGAASLYEATPTGPGLLAGPDVMRIADVAGFYRAFGFEARGERPDHLSAQLEFLALVCLQEAHARLAGLREEAQVCAEARRSFLRDHLAWTRGLAERVRTATSRASFYHLVALVESLIASDTP